MEDISCLALSFLGFMSTLKGQPLDTTVYGEIPLIPVHPMKYPIETTNKYGNPVDEKG